MQTINIFIVCLISIGAVPLMLILMSPRIGNENKVWHKLAFKVTLVLLIIIFYSCFKINNWQSIETPQNTQFIFIYKPAIVIGFTVFGLFLTTIRDRFLNGPAFFEILTFFYMIFFVINMVSAFDFLTMFIMLEAVNICTFIIIASNTNNIINFIASLRYLMVSMLSIALLLLGVILLYIETSTFEYNSVAKFCNLQSNLVTNLGMLLILISFLIKLGLSPFYSWLITVYNGVSINAFLILTTFIKTAIYVTFYNFLTIGYFEINSGILWLSSISSIAIGTIGAMFSLKLNSFVGYSSLYSMGTVNLLLVEAVSALDGAVVFFYILVYNISISYLLLFYVNTYRKAIDSGFLYQRDGVVAIPQVSITAHIVNLYSLMNLPPFLGFYGKLWVTYILYMKSAFLSLLIIFIFSIIACYYYIRLYLVFFLRTKMSGSTVIYSAIGRGFDWLVILSNLAFNIPAIFYIVSITSG